MKLRSERKIDLRYLDLNERKQQAINKRRSEDIVLDIGKDDKILRIEIIDASKPLYFENLWPLPYEMVSLRHHHGR
jgi:uncharacterized protein YuzE